MSMPEQPAPIPASDEPPRHQADASTTLASVDLGSNSFHLLIARLSDGQVRFIDRLKEMVRLAAGLDADRYLTPEAIARGEACLERFGQRLRALDEANVRVLGTNTLRSAKNAESVLRRFQDALGHPIEIIDGREEARLIYHGVVHDLGDEAGTRIVFDIGGGSTELIVGRGARPELMESLHIGCVSLSQRFFRNGRLSASAFEAADTAARLELAPFTRPLSARHWDRVIGASGTIRAAADIIQANGWGDVITRDGLAQIRAALRKARHIDAVKLKGLSDERRPVFHGGLVILQALFDSLGLARMEVSEAALREGAIVDLAGRLQHVDIREATVAALARRYQVDEEHAEAVRRTAECLMGRLGAAWGGEDPWARHQLDWAAHLHEIGLAISHSKYHRHGGYLLEHSDMPGFSRQDQHRLAVLVRSHRRKLRREVIASLPEEEQERALRLTVILRLAVLLHRSRNPMICPFGVDWDESPRVLVLRFAEGWLETYPLTRADLLQEAEQLERVGIRLTLE